MRLLENRYGNSIGATPAPCASAWEMRARLRIARFTALFATAFFKARLFTARLTAAFFTKFNYGALLLAALAADRALEALVAARRGRLGALAGRCAWLAAVPLVVGAWWFLFPWPGGSEHAVLHRRALLDFLAGNLEMAPTPGELRALYWGAAFVPAPVSPTRSDAPASSCAPEKRIT